ncbi:MAG: NADH-quinone oxidoreductase subunit NuoE [Candidatus Hydrogenedentes bacterium]|nr:NADH-quinone oxidoreductase subunit NuoE [Candidatus Hydrogenedentota bacterium]
MCKDNAQTTQLDTWKEVEAFAKRTLPPHVVEFIEEAQREPHPESKLIKVLQLVQEHYGYLGKTQMDAVAQLMQIPTAKVSGVATFYHYFRLVPRGKYMIRICLGTACYVKGAERVVEKLKEELGIHFGETTKDGLFSLEGTRCLGCCGLAPVVEINGEVFGQVTPDKIPAILEHYSEKTD